MLEQTVQIVSNERDTDSYFRLVVRAPRIAPLIQPGQFAHVRVLPLKDALLRRPFSIFQVSGDTFSILYKTVGKGTEILARMQAGEELSVIAPLGHGFTVPKRGGETPLLVAGGYGMAAMYLLAQRSPQKGHRLRRRPAARGHFVRKGISGARLGRARDHRGRQSRQKRTRHPAAAGRTETQGGQAQSADKLFACGPTGMLKAVGKIAEEFKVPAELSMDEHMCCGVGVCLTCVIPVKTGPHCGTGNTSAPAPKARCLMPERLFGRKPSEFAIYARETSNIQHSTFNVQPTGNA